MKITYKINDRAEFEVFSNNNKIGEIVRDDKWWRFLPKNVSRIDAPNLLEQDIEDSKRVLEKQIKDMVNFVKTL